ncbi:MAG: glycoside hydrolase family 5 protein [Candidatus Omnitrophota bacterium]|jgi:aryl-phospho-beta-D-glucosidase BglC (GH1 family)
MLKTKDSAIIDSMGKKIILRGVNLGGWLMMEGYILYGRNISEKSFKAEMARRWGGKELENFTREFRNNFIKEEDFKNIANLGFNCVRLPFNHKLIENQDKNHSINKNGIGLLKKAVSWCKKRDIYCILDMHAAPGSQNQDWHADSDGEMSLWKDKKCRERYYRLWEELAENFKGEEGVAGYNILNEPVIKKGGAGILRPFYKEAVKRIRAVDSGHIIFLEGNIWSQRLEDIGEPFADNLSYSIHFYHPLEFTFNFHRDLSYPGRINGETWNFKKIKEILGTYHGYSKKWNVPVFAGEFGVNSRCGKCSGELEWVRDTLECFKEFGFHWTYWTYKAVSNSVFPDGIYQYTANPPWISRQGPVYGFENFYTLWKGHKNAIIGSWKTEGFKKNEPLANLLASFGRI